MNDGLTCRNALALIDVDFYNLTANFGSQNHLTGLDAATELQGSICIDGVGLILPQPKPSSDDGKQDG